MTPGLVDELNDIIDEHPHDWILDAMKIAVKRNARNIAYFGAILKRWKAEGKGSMSKAEMTYDEKLKAAGYK